MLLNQPAMGNAERTETYESCQDPLEGRSVRGPYLVSLFNCARPLEPSARISIARAERVEIGRGERLSVYRNLIESKRVCRVQVADVTMSALHALIVQDGDGTFRLWDCGSKNGTTLGGKRVETPTPLVDRDLIAAGSSFFLFRAHEECYLDEPFDLEAERSLFATLNPSFAREVGKLRAIAKTDLPVLIEGPTSSGRSSAAKAVHDESGRIGPFVRIAASELFDSLATLRRADGGTLYLDGIEHLGKEAAEVLCSVLDPGDWGQAAREGDPLRIRILASGLTGARRSLSPKLASRIAAHVFETPPLSARPEDLGIFIGRALASANAASSVRFERPAARALLSYSWPGNFDELLEVIRHAVAFAGDAAIDRAHLPELLREHERSGRQRRRLIALFEKHRGNVTAVARALGVSRMQVHRLAQSCAIEPADYRTGVPRP